MAICVAHVLWSSGRSSDLDQFESIHKAIGKSGAGTQDARQQINQAYVLMLSAQFQGFCRDLHSEAIDFLIDSLPTSSLRSVFQSEFQYGRKLDSGNPNVGNIGSDFNRLGFRFWDAVHAQNSALKVHQDALIALNEWRNAIAHQSFDPVRLGGSTRLRHSQIKTWRRSCDVLANAFVAVVSDRLMGLIGKRPW